MFLIDFCKIRFNPDQDFKGLAFDNLSIANLNVREIIRSDKRLLSMPTLVAKNNACDGYAKGFTL